MAELFDQPGKAAGDGESPASGAGGRVVSVAVAANVWDSYDYLWPVDAPQPALGQRVRVPFGRGNRLTSAFVVDTLGRGRSGKLKTVAEVVDPQTQLDEYLWKLSRWIGDYYLSPPGMVLSAMIPSAVGRHPSRTETVVFLTSEPADWPGRLGSRQRRVLDELIEARKQGVELLTIEDIKRHSGASRQSINKLVQRGLVRLEGRPVRLDNLAENVGEDPFELNADQKDVLAAMESKLAAPWRFTATLLHGVTGSGKTEIYIRAIRRVVNAGRQAILLVPEIALATQTIHRLVKRLPRVAVLHSGLTDVQRAFYYEQIRDGHADVVIGPRSAVFAPARKLGLVIVDEEHESSYKQDNVPRYHGRDVAVMRASLTGVPVLLGSATPSLESLHNVRRKSYDLVRLPHRVLNLPMPTLEIVNLRREITPGPVELIGATLTNKMAAALNRNEQIILLMNRRGYASYVFCPSCKWEMTCRDCTRTMVYHRATRMVMCHYCRRTEDLPQRCPACKGKLLLFGMGIQRIESEMARKFPAAKLARMDSDTMTSPMQFQRVLSDFQSGELDVLLGTQMVAKGLDFPRVSLVGVVSADTTLSIPDFRSAERTFQLIVQVAGRAGRSAVAGQVVVQTLHPDEPAIRFAAKHDYQGFAELEMSQRAEAGFPPLRRMVRFIVRHQDVSRAQQGCEELARQLRQILPMRQVTMYGPLQAAIAKIRNRFRFELQLFTAQPGMIQQMLRPRMHDICRANPAEVIADVDPVNLL